MMQMKNLKTWRFHQCILKEKTKLALVKDFKSFPSSTKTYPKSTLTNLTVDPKYLSKPRSQMQFNVKSWLLLILNVTVLFLKGTTHPLSTLMNKKWFPRKGQIARLLLAKQLVGELELQNRLFLGRKTKNFPICRSIPLMMLSLNQRHTIALLHIATQNFLVTLYFSPLWTNLL